MREILFRGKSKETGEWTYGYLFKGVDYLDGHHIVAIIEENTDIYPRSEVAYEEVDPETVGQWTGLVDKNGSMIFEGDVVQIKGMITSVTGYYHVIYSGPIHCWALERSAVFYHHFFTFSELNGFTETSVIVGNIHDDLDSWNIR